MSMQASRKMQTQGWGGMTENDLRVQLAEIRASLKHLEEDMQEAKSERQKWSDKMETFVSRLVTLETSGGALLTLPERVSHAETVNEVQTAVRDERTHVISEMRKTILGGFAVGGTIAGIIFSIIAAFSNGG